VASNIVPDSRALLAMLHDSTHSRVRESMSLLVGLSGRGRAGPLIHARAEGLGAAAVPSLGPLMKLLGDPDAGTRSAAISAFSQMGASARGAIPLLTQLQNDPDTNAFNRN